MTERHPKRDSLTELENFIDSYAADETEDDEDETEEDEQQKMINLLKQQMLTNLTLMNHMNKSPFPAARFPLGAAGVLPNPLLQNFMMPNLLPNLNPTFNLLQTPTPNLLNFPTQANIGIANKDKVPLVGAVNPTLNLNPGLLNLNPYEKKFPLINPFNQAQPIPKKEGQINQPYPTVMIPGVGPCLMIPQEATQNHFTQSFFDAAVEKASAELKKRFESVDSENRTLRRRSSIDTSNFPKEILREPPKRRSSMKEESKDSSVVVKSKVRKDRKHKEKTHRVITIKSPSTDKYDAKERRHSKTEKREISDSQDEKPKKEKVKGGHEVYIPPLRRGSETSDLSQNSGNQVEEEVTKSKKLEKPIKSILKKPKEYQHEPAKRLNFDCNNEVNSDKNEKQSSPKISPKKTNEENEKTDCREQKEINNFVEILEKLGTDDNELPNIAELILKKAIRKHSQVGRLIKECLNLIEKKPLFRTVFLQCLQKTHSERKSIKKNNRQNFIGLTLVLVEVYLTIQTADGVAFQVLVLPIKQNIIEILNDSNFDERESQFLCDIMVRLGPLLTVNDPESLEIIMATARAISIHVNKISPETRKYLLKLVESYAHCWESLNAHTEDYFKI